MKNIAPASACFFCYEQVSWVRPNGKASRNKQFAFVFLDQQPPNPHSFKFKVKVWLFGLLSSPIVQTFLFALQSKEHIQKQLYKKLL